MFNNFKKPIQRVPRQEEGCKIKVNRDKMGRIKSISTNGKCSKSEIDVFRENLNSFSGATEED